MNSIDVIKIRKTIFCGYNKKYGLALEILLVRIKHYRKG